MLGEAAGGGRELPWWKFLVLGRRWKQIGKLQALTGIIVELNAVLGRIASWRVSTDITKAGATWVCHALTGALFSRGGCSRFAEDKR